ncbi:snRNA-activating protein complex subunit 4 isoform X2 [Acanthochromis polyacanthus]|uniref:snRNA-activating protein complex subunit 4 isoform X2 n=1 Tax=Acanthochromis polyacanthus TaxID=80966 RepID=UPI002233F218|nr:snRNA-activating protein complex subunit 4 isoform X2 [Acanthochromis polyacanthus]
MNVRAALIGAPQRVHRKVMSDLSAQRNRIQQQVKQLQERLKQNELELLSSETDDDSDDEDLEDNVGQTGQCAAGLLAQRDQIQKEIQNLEDVLGPLSPISVSDDDDDSSSSDESVGLSLSVDSCLQMNLVYQQVVQETLTLLETHLLHNQRQQKELIFQLSGPIRESPREQPAPSSYQRPITMYLGRFLKPYFKDKLTGLGPPANQETKEKASRMTGCLDDRKLKVKRWESWQKTLLIHSVSRDNLKRLIQPKLSKVDYLTQKLSSAAQTDRGRLREQIDSLEREIDLLRGKREEELTGGRQEEHDWQKISNIDFEGTKDAEDIRRFWQNFLHPSINKNRWSPEEVQHLKEVSRRHGDRHWDVITTELGTGRTAFMCLQMFQRFVSGSLRRGSWTPSEDALLRELVEKMRIGNFIPYTQMSYFMEGRDPAQLIYRWNQVLDPSLKRGPWTKEEDQLLLRAVSRYGEKNWWKIRMEVPGRTDSSCRDRYHDSLKAGMKRGAFDRQERDLLLRLVKKHGVGRWAKIAAEIPHRFDAQCLREWKKLSRLSGKKQKKGQRSGGGEKKKKDTTKKKIRRRLKRIKKEEEEESSEEEEMVIPYMDSDDEKKMEVEERSEEQQEEEEFSFPPMQDWVPEERAEPSSSLSFRPVLLPSSTDALSGTPVRSTVVGKFSCSSVLGPPPRPLQRDERHSSTAMMMVSPEELRVHLQRQAHRFNHQSSRRRRRVHAGQKPLLGRVTDIGVGYQLQAAVTPWVGNLLIPANPRRTAADVLRENGQKKSVSLTPVFLLLLQATNVDILGCREMIEQRKSKVLMLTPPPDPDTIKLRDPKTVAGMLQLRDAMTEQPQWAEQASILQQLHAIQQQKKLNVQEPRPALIQPMKAPQLRPSLLLQMSPQMPPQMSPQMPPQMRPQMRPQMPPQMRPQMPPQMSPQITPQISPQMPPQMSPQMRPQMPPQMRPQMPPQMPPQITPQMPPQMRSQMPPQMPPHIPSMPPQMSPHAVFVPRPVIQQLRPSSPAAPLRSSVGDRAVKVQGTRTLLEVGEGHLTFSAPTFSECPQSAQIQNIILLPPQNLRPLQLVAPPTSVDAPVRLDAPRVFVDPSNKRVSSTQNVSLAPPPCVQTNHGAPILIDHDYYLPLASQPSPAPKQTNTKGRERGEEPQPVTSSQDNHWVDRTGTGGILEGKRVRKPTRKARALQESTEAKAEAKKKRTSSLGQKRRRRSEVIPLVQPRWHLLPAHSLWVMTPAGLVQLPETLPQSLQLPLVPPPPPVPLAPPPPVPLAPPPLLLATGGPKSPESLTVSAQMTQSLPAPPSCHYKPHPSPPFPDPAPIPLLPPPPSKLPLPYKGMVRADPAEPPPLRREALQFDPALMFLEPQVQVCDWLSGKGGVSVPGAGVALPYLPPFVSSLSTLSALLQSKKSLTKASLQLLCRGSEPRHPRTTPDTPDTRQPPPDLPDSTSDLHPSEEQPAPSASSAQQQQEDEEDEEVTMVEAVRHLVEERFSGNPAYQLLKARFLSCFTVPALLATVQPITGKTVDCPANQEEEEEEEEEPRKARQRGRRRVQRTLLLNDDSRAPANHFSGIISADQTGLDRPGPDQ